MTAASVRSTAKPGMYRDGKTTGLYLQVTGATAKSWLYRYMLAGKARAMGLGSAMPGQVPLAEARQMAQTRASCSARGLTPSPPGKAL